MPDTMLAGVLAGPKQIEIKEVPIPQAGAGEIQIRVNACGVCGSDVHMWQTGRGWYKEPITDFRMGHEFCGTVTDPGTSSFKVGDRVTFWANLYCGICDMCRAGLEHLCRDVHGTNYIGFVCHGASAQYFSGKAGTAYRLPDTVSDLDAALIDPLMVAYHAVKHSALRLHGKVLVVGSGIIAQLIGGLAKKQGAALLAMSRIDDRQIGWAKKIGDFDLYFDGNAHNREELMQGASEGGFDVVFEAVGTGESLAACLDGVKPGGEIVMIGNSIPPTVPFEMNRTVLNEVTIKGSVSCTRVEFEETIDLIAQDIIDPEQYISDVFELDDLQKAFEKQISNEPFLKAVITP